MKTRFLCIVSILSILAAVSPAAGQVVLGDDPYPSFYRGTLPFYHDLFTFRGPDGSTEVVAAFAVPAGGLERERRSGRTRYRFDVTLVLADTALRTVTRRDDSVFVALRGALSGDHLLYTHLSVHARPSSTTVQRAILTDATTPGRGQLHDAPFVIPDYSGSALMLSDIALGEPDRRAGWRRHDVRLALLPTQLFPQSAFDVYYEIYNLPRGHRYTTEVEVLPLSGRDGVAVPSDSAISLRFSGEADTRSDGSVRELRRVETSLSRGRYRLTVRITDDVTGAAASRSREFHVRGWGPGTTLVVARPR